MLRRALADRRFGLWSLGCLQLSSATIWLARSRQSPRISALCALWLLTACALTVLTAFVPASAWFAGLALGGALSHVIETWVRGCVTDFICPTFWPAFNLADAAIVAGGFGIAATAFLVFA
jgi:signal peptidase II